MMKQLTLATAKGFDVHGRATRKAEFLARLEKLVPWAEMCGRIRDFDVALRGLSGKPRTGIVTMSLPGFQLVAGRFNAAALKHRLPSIRLLRIYAQAGMLMCYGPTQEIYLPRAVVLADKILRGARPGELSIEGPDRFELVLNLATARALGLKLPQPLLLRADEVIE